MDIVKEFTFTASIKKALLIIHGYPINERPLLRVNHFNRDRGQFIGIMKKYVSDAWIYFDVRNSVGVFAGSRRILSLSNIIKLEILDSCS